MLITLSHINMAAGEPINIGLGPRTSLTKQPGSELALDPETGLVFASVGAEVYAIPSASIRQMRVASEDVAVLRDWLKARAAKKTKAA